MSLDYEIIGITVLWTFLYLYVIIASIDFGAGFFNFYSKLTGDDNIISPIIARYLSPVWETTNVFLFSSLSALWILSGYCLLFRRHS